MLCLPKHSIPMEFLMKYKISHNENGELESYVGDRIRLRRMELGLTQNKLAEMLDVSFQQVQKYEAGRNAMKITSLFRLARVLLVDISYFFEGFKDYTLQDSGRASEMVQSREMSSLMRNYQNISNERLRKSVSNLVRALSVNN